MMPPQQHLYNGLARPVDYSIIAREWIHPQAGESTLAQETPARTTCWPTADYGQRRLPTTSMLAYGQRGSSRC